MLNCHTCSISRLGTCHTNKHNSQPPKSPPNKTTQVGYGRKTYTFTKDLLLSWGQFQLPWAQVDAHTGTAPGTPVCVTANVFGLWTAVPLEIV